MRTAVVQTEEIDDIEAAVSELTEGVRERLGSLDSHAVALVLSDSEADVERLSAGLHERLGCPAVGFTATAQLESQFGYCDCGITVAVMTGDDVEFGVAFSESISADTAKTSIRRAYEEARAQLSEDPKMIVLGAPYTTDVSPDIYVPIFNELSGGVPIFGGVACDHYALSAQKTFLNGRSSSTSAAFFLVAGDTDPIFAIRHHANAVSSPKGVVTKSDGQKVIEINGEPFKNFVSDMLLMPDQNDHYETSASWSTGFLRLTAPFFLELPDHEIGDEEIVTPLFDIDSDGAGIFSMTVPEGTKLSIHSMHKSDVLESCRETLDLLEHRLKASGDTDRSVMFVASCNGRNVLLGGDKSGEAHILKGMLADHPGMEMIGCYAFGEFCPVGAARKNRFHNLSFAVCVM